MMPCKPCQKNQRRPLSPAAVRQRQEERKQAQQRNAPLSPAKQPSSDDGKASSKRTASFVLQTIDGRTQAFGSRLEADAARVRAGGGTIRRF